MMTRKKIALADSNKGLIKQFEKDFKDKKLLQDVKTVAKELGKVSPVNPKDIK